MTNPPRLLKEPFSEADATAALGITVPRFHQLLDKQIFTQGGPRPESIEFTSNLLLLS